MADNDRIIESTAEMILKESDRMNLSDLMVRVIERLPEADRRSIRQTLLHWVGRQTAIVLTWNDAPVVNHAQKENILSADEKKLSVDEFVYLAILQGAKPPYTGIHTVFSGFNASFREYYAQEGLDPINEVERMAKEGKLIRHYVTGGVIISVKPGFRIDFIDKALGVKKSIG